METFRNGSESRKYPRVSFKRAVKFKMAEAELFCGELAQDLSGGGIRVRSSIFIPVGEQVSLGIQLKDVDQVVELHGKVKWVRFSPYTETYQLRFEFIEHETDFSRSRINRFISHS